ncbi:putative F-box protein At1g65770 [Quercus lobata]|nr:putative F-box protein At1g65770 [Quercus lobata]
MEKSKKENKGMDDGERVEWSELPKELLPTIGKNLDTRIDIVRFRSVCNTWRSSIPLFHTYSPRFPLIFPSPYPAPIPIRTPAYLCQSTVYRLQRLNPSSTSSNKSWLIKVEQDSNSGGKFRLFDPISNRRTRYPNKTLNLFDFRVVELTKAYTLRYQVRVGLSTSTNEIEQVLSVSDISIFGVNKVVMFPNSPWTNVNASAAFVIFNDGKLGFAKSGDEELILVDRNSFDYDDIIVYKGQFYVINSLGIVSWIDHSSLKLVQFLPPLCGLGSQKHLVESCGALYVVDRYLDRERRRVENDAFYMGGEDCAESIGFKVYRFDEEWGRWELKESLGDRAFVLGNGCCFSVMAKELSGYKRNCIYFTDQYETRVFSLEDNSVGYLSYFEDSYPSWPLPNLL